VADWKYFYLEMLELKHTPASTSGSEVRNQFMQYLIFQPERVTRGNEVWFMQA
jgi:hypothetical protein